MNRGFVKSSGGSSGDSRFYGSVPPPSQLNPNVAVQTSYKTMSGAGFLASTGMDAVAATMQYGMNARRRAADDEDYFDEPDEPTPQIDLEYQPAPDSPGTNKDQQEDSGDDSDDPLDAFMAGVEVQAKTDKEKSVKHAQEIVNKKESKEVAKPMKEKKQQLGRVDIDLEDDQESYFRWVEEQKARAGADDEEEDDVEYDDDGNAFRRKRIIDPLPAVDHSEIEYFPFEKNFYHEHSQIMQLKADEVAQLRIKLGVKVVGMNSVRPAHSFAHFGFDERLLSVIRKSEFTQPTPIQAQGIPIAMSGRDIIGIAKTGSGKTAAFVWPAIVHIMDQPELEPGDGPIALICVPTRELAIQVYNEAKKYAKVFNINVVCAYGGGSKWEQSKALQEGAEIVVCTPGRIIDHVKIGATNFRRVTYLVFDEADRMFDLGFEPQVRSMANHIRPDRQCLMFSATFKRKIERLARDILVDPLKVIQGELGEANEDIEQNVLIFNNPPDKWNWLTTNLVKFTSIGKVLIFVGKKSNAEEVAKNLAFKDFGAALLHGDMFQHERNETIQKFRQKGGLAILVATDVAARGLDIPAIKTVVNYDVARDIDTHVHRIGRTGRAGEKGTAYTLVIEKDKEFAGHLVRNLESVNQPVPEQLMRLAMQSQWFRSSRFKQGKAKRIGMGGRGLGFKERPGFVGSGESDGASATSGFNLTSIGVKQALSNVKSPSDRLSAMRAAYSSHYTNKFQSASAETAWESQHRVISDPTPEWKKKISQWKEVNKDFINSETAPPVQDGGFKAPGPIAGAEHSSLKKRSRWE